MSILIYDCCLQKTTTWFQSILQETNHDVLSTTTFHAMHTCQISAHCGLGKLLAKFLLSKCNCKPRMQCHACRYLGKWRWLCCKWGWLCCTWGWLCDTLTACAMRAWSEIRSDQATRLSYFLNQDWRLGNTYPVSLFSFKSKVHNNHASFFFPFFFDKTLLCLTYPLFAG